MTETVSTGIPALDVFLGGGVPKGYSILLLAPTGSGEELFAKQFAQGRGAERVTFVTTDETLEEACAAVRDAGWSFENVRVVDVQSQFADEILHGRLERRPARPRFDPRDLVDGTHSRDMLPRKEVTDAAREPYLENLLLLASQDPPPDRFIVDSLDFYLNLYDHDEVIATMHALDATNAKRHGVHLWVLAKDAHDARTQLRLELMADCIIELEVNRRGAALERYLIVRKVKNRNYGTGVSTYSLTRNGFVLETLDRIT
jgi:KaiC/GvpD/RAD55 family RecA-like ATPase